ncbi:MAG: GxxExxY protein [Candidatus Wenzhouxiangella sp. M2_3B_020]
MNADLNALSERVIGCVYRVSNMLGSGFLEAVCENALALELSAADVDYERQKRMKVYYRRVVVGEFVADFVIRETMVVELKAVRSILPEYQAQLLNYLHAADLRVGLLINFGTPKVQVKRLVNGLRSS